MYKRQLEHLEEILAGYGGTLLVVSHDRAFLDGVVTSTLVAEGGGRWGEYVGGWSDWVRTRDARAAAAETTKPTRPRSSAERPVASDRPRKATFGEQREHAGLPARIERLEAERDALFARMGAADFHRVAAAEVAAARERLSIVEKEIEAAYARWEELEAIVAGG